MNPIELFKQWQKEELESSQVQIPKACCLSTIGLDGYPNARFLELKDVIDACFILTGPTDTRKGSEINDSDKVAITCWWTATEKQIRIQGQASKLSGEIADSYFEKEHIDAQIVCNMSKQGQDIANPRLLLSQIDRFKQYGDTDELKRPENWGGYAILPIRIEFLEYKANHLHTRKLYEMVDGEWKVKQLQA